VSRRKSPAPAPALQTPVGEAAAPVERPALPPQDLPSPEVLDELLKAFAADAVDTKTLRTIDLDSPEVEELLAPTAPTTAGGDDARPEVEVENGDPEPAAEVQVTGDPQPEVESSPDPEPAVDGEATAIEAAVDPPPEGEPEPPAPGTGTVRTIVIDASEDPPDAVYLAAGDPLLTATAKGSSTAAPTAPTAVRDRSEGTVFIDDQDVGLGETISIADASAATRIEPRMRDRRIAVKRAAGRKRLRWVLVVVGVLVLLIAGLAVLGSSLFAVKTVKVDGAVYTDKAALQKVVDELDGTPVLRVDTAKAERELEAIPWVDAARVTTHFPNRATIELRERTPVATLQGPDQQFRVLDDKGRVLDVLPAQPAQYLLLVAADAQDLRPGQFAPQGYVAAASLARALTPEVRAKAESATVTADGSDLRLQLQGGVEVRFGPARDLVAKLVRLQTKLDELEGGGLQYIDVSTNEVTMG
jgi:cell division protein FtsQ